MKDNARLVLEENQNLLEQIDVKDQKAYDLHQAHVREGSEKLTNIIPKCRKIPSYCDLCLRLSMLGKNFSR